MIDMATKDFYTAEEAADLLGITKTTIEQRIRRGELIASKRFGKWYVLHSDLITYLTAGRITPAEAKTIFNPKHGIESNNNNSNPNGNSDNGSASG